MITVYSKNDCGYCMQAKLLLQKNNIEFREINIDEVAEAKQFVVDQGHKTLPQLYKDGKLFVEGGCEGLIQYLEEQNTLNTLGDLSL